MTTINIKTARSLFILLLAAGSCSNAEERIDNLGSNSSCKTYCSRKFECASYKASDEESNNCRDDCRDHLEVNCGNNKQDAANEKINECADKTCEQFVSCLVLQDTPECLNFAK